MIGLLLGVRLRRDGRQLLLWVLGTAAMGYLSYVGVSESFNTDDQRSALLATALANPVVLLFRGLPSGPDAGAFMVFLILPWLALLAALMSTFLAVRHTRMDEEDGRSELVSATPAGRTLPVVATALHGFLANVTLAVGVALAFLAAGLSIGGALLTGAAAASVGLVFLGVGLLASQLMRTSRGANAFSVWTVLIALLACGLGNAIGTPSDDLTRMESSWLAWLSPFGWAENTRPFADDAWWPLLLCLALGALLVGVAVSLATTRDLGESFVPERYGRADATPALSTSTGLVWRLTRGAALGWAFGGLIAGALSTTLASVVEEIGAENPTVEDMLTTIAGGVDIEQATVTTFLTMMGILAACAGVQVVTRARQEEARGTAEIVLATPLHRVRWLADHLVIGVAAVLVVVVAAIAGAALGLSASGGERSLMEVVYVTAGGQAVAASVFVVLTAVVFTLAPRLTIPAGWSLVLLGAVLGLFAPIFGLPEWVTRLSPFGVAPLVDGDAIDVRGLWWLVIAVAVGAALACGLMRRRELAPAG